MVRLGTVLALPLVLLVPAVSLAPPQIAITNRMTHDRCSLLLRAVYESFGITQNTKGRITVGDFTEFAELLRHTASDSEEATYALHGIIRSSPELTITVC